MKPILFLFCCLVQVLKSDAQFLDSDTCRSVSGSNVCLRQGPCGTQVQALQRYSRVLYPTKNKLSCQLNGAATDFAQVNYKGSTGTWMAASYLGCCNSGVITSAPAWATNVERAAIQWLLQQGITNIRPISVILGNLKQESNLDPTMCETIGAVASLSACPSTRGIGLLQWTGVRHQSFNTYFNQHNGAWTSAQSQLNFLATEPQWTTARSCFASSRDIDDAWDNAQATAGSYWKCAATWIGWGTLGNRIQYAGEYLAKL